MLPSVTARPPATRYRTQRQPASRPTQQVAVLHDGNSNARSGHAATSRAPLLRLAVWWQPRRHNVVTTTAAAHMMADDAHLSSPATGPSQQAARCRLPTSPRRLNAPGAGPTHFCAATRMQQPANAAGRNETRHLLRAQRGSASLLTSARTPPTHIQAGPEAPTATQGTGEHRLTHTPPAPPRHEWGPQCWIACRDRLP